LTTKGTKEELWYYVARKYRKEIMIILNLALFLIIYKLVPFFCVSDKMMPCLEFIKLKMVNNICYMKVNTELEKIIVITELK
jgi:hypothetical protein